MFMEQPKFIITMDGFLRLGMVNQHKDLLLGDDKCIGGGYYQFYSTSFRFLPHIEDFVSSISMTTTKRTIS